MNIEIGAGWAKTLNRDLIRGCIFRNLKIFLTTGEKVCMFFQHTNLPDLSVFGGMFLLPAHYSPMWNGNGDFCGGIGRI